jgi:hypothetical protein
MDSEGDLKIDIRLVGVPPETVVVEVRRNGTPWVTAEGDLRYDNEPSPLRWPAGVEMPEAVRRELDRRIGSWVVDQRGA